MNQEHVRSATRAIEDALEILGDRSSFRTRILLDMLLRELKAERSAVGEASDRPRDRMARS